MGYLFCQCVHQLKIWLMRFLANATFSRSQKSHLARTLVHIEIRNCQCLQIFGHTRTLIAHILVVCLALLLNTKQKAPEILHTRVEFFKNSDCKKRHWTSWVVQKLTFLLLNLQKHNNVILKTIQVVAILNSSRSLTEYK